MAARGGVDGWCSKHPGRGWHVVAELYGAAEDALFRSGGNEDAVLALTEEALARLVDIEPASRADVLRRAGEVRGHSAPQKGLQLLNEAVALYEQLPLSEGLLWALREISTILLMNGRQVEASDVSIRAVVLAEGTSFRRANFEIRGQQAWHAAAAGAGEIALEQIRVLRQSLTRESLTQWDEPIMHGWLAVIETEILFSLGRLGELEESAAPALKTVTGYGADKSLGAAVLRANVVAALIELGSVNTAGRLIDPVTRGPVYQVTRLDYGARANVETLRGNLDAAERQWAEIRGTAADMAGLAIENCLLDADLHLWLRNPQTALEQAEAVLAESIEVNQGALSGLLHALTAPLLTLSVRACADLAEHARANQDDMALTVAQRRAAKLSEMHQQIQPDPFTLGPLRPTATADAATWQAEWTRLRGPSDPRSWEHAAAAWDALTRPHRAAYARCGKPKPCCRRSWNFRSLDHRNSLGSGVFGGRCGRYRLVVIVASWSSRSDSATGWSQCGQGPPRPTRRAKLPHWSQRCSP